MFKILSIFNLTFKSRADSKYLKEKLKPMATETERKYLVLNDNYKAEAYQSSLIKQGYLSSHQERTVRVRIMGDKGFLTIKGASDDLGVSRYEWELEIPVPEAEELLNICEPGTIEKIRYNVHCGNHIFEVDEFLEENLGLVVAEIELLHQDESFLRPQWLGLEVTGDLRYYNSALSKNPYSRW